MTVKGRKPMPIHDLAASPIENDSTVDSSVVCFLQCKPTKQWAIVMDCDVLPNHRCHCMKCSKVNSNTRN